jgi:hypothetical protein
VIKRTKTRIYVDREIYGKHSRTWWDEHPESRRCLTLDRQEFERHGAAWSAAKREMFFPTKEAVMGDWTDELPFGDPNDWPAPSELEEDVWPRWSMGLTETSIVGRWAQPRRAPANTSTVAAVPHAVCGCYNSATLTAWG